MTEAATPLAAVAAPHGKPWENLFGVCAALGEDFGFNPLWLRVAFGAGLIFQPVGVIAAYLGLGLIVLASRRIAPPPRGEVGSAGAEPVSEPVPSAPVALPRSPARADADQELPIAA